jgi:uncharacterized SAM-binding protein YcdF (DUF218 family)
LEVVVQFVLIICGIACLVYGITILLTFSGTLFFAVWFVMAAGLLSWAHAIRVGAWQLLPGVMRAGISTLVALGLVGTILLGMRIMAESFEEPPDDLDYLVVLGAQVYRNAPSEILRYRLDAACDYLAAHPDTRVVVSGGQGPNEPCPEADVMARYLEQHGIETTRILRERRSETTKQNLVYSRELIARKCSLSTQGSSENMSEQMGLAPRELGNADDDSSEEISGRTGVAAHELGDAETGVRIGIVTNSFHLFRALRLARSLDMRQVWGIAAGVRPWYLPNNLLRECMGVTKDLLLGNITL